MIRVILAPTPLRPVFEMFLEGEVFVVLSFESQCLDPFVSVWSCLSAILLQPQSTTAQMMQMMIMRTVPESTPMWTQSF